MEHLSFSQAIRKRFGHKAIAKKAGIKSVKMGSIVRGFFSVVKRELEFKRKVEKTGKNGKKRKVTETFKKETDICHASDASEYIQYLLKLRGLDPKKTLVRLGLDGGRGSLKIMVSVFDPTATGEAPINWMNLDLDKIDGTYPYNTETCCSCINIYLSVQSSVCLSNTI